ncbi:MAG: hypothetical protein KR126chlam3_01015 [Chlamydiae bacterium]|nr:hypothetical protein [Chlamydiota bacterium]
MMKIWERYILREFFKLFALFLFGFYFLYVVIDYSAHMQDLTLGKNLALWKIFQYYLLQFIKRMDILLPLALLIGTIKVLCQFNTNRELLALLSAGIRMKKLMRPLFFIGSCIVLINLGVNEFVVPHSLNFIDKFHDAHLRHSFRGNRTEPLHVMHLDDHSKLVYQYYDAAREALFDVIWIRNHEDLWRMRYLKIDPQHPHGQWVDHLERNKEGCFEKTESFASLIFHNLDWNQDMPRKGYIPFENRSMKELWKILRTDPLLSSFEKNEVLSQFLFKLTMPFLALLVLFAIIPFCTNYSKNLPQFFIYSMGIFSFVAFIALMDAAVILGESDTLSPFVAILSPFIVLLSIFGWRFAKAK